jgi:hypothetical protein
MAVEDTVDIVLYDSFAQPESDHEEIAVLIDNPRARRVVVYTWNFDAPSRARSAVGLDWPGRGEGLSDRESEILALITQGKSNAEVAKLTYLSPNIEVIHPIDLPQDRRRQPDPGCPLGSGPRLDSRLPPHRTLEGWPLSGLSAYRSAAFRVGSRVAVRTSPG